MSRSSARRSAVAIAKIVAVAVLVCHVTLTAAYCLPYNPMSATLSPILQPTIGRFFMQNWRLFAPDPVSSNYDVLVHCLDGDQAARALRGELPTGDWQNLSQPMWTAFHRNRFGAYDRLSRPLNNAVRQYLFGPADLSTMWKSCTRGADVDCELSKQAYELAQKDAAPMLQRVGSSYCRARTDADSFTAVALRVRETKPTPWSQRYESRPRTVEEYAVGVFPIDPHQIPGEVYR